MTQHKHFKQLVRARMEKTGERYATARRHLADQPESAGSIRFPWHRPGSVPATNALRILLTAAGVSAPHNQKPFSEAMLFGVAGGIGAGMFAFQYPQFSSFYLAGRHLWQDDVVYLKSACHRLGAEVTIQETGGEKQADKQLRAALSGGQPVLAWVDLGLLPHRAMPSFWEGGGYHVIVVHALEDDPAIAWISDLTDEPIAISQVALAASRARIKKQKNRLLTLQAGGRVLSLETLVRLGMKACQDGLTNARMKNFTLQAFQVWAERLHGNRSKDSWETMFPPGKRLWRGLASVYDFIEHYGTGGGLMRPIFADFFREAHAALNSPVFSELGERYQELGRLWSDLARAALPEEVPLLRKTRLLHEQKAQALHDGAAIEEVRKFWQELDQCEIQAEKDFPLSAGECADLRRELQRRVRELHEKEAAALEVLS